jgi:hypothetical protein
MNCAKCCPKGLNPGYAIAQIKMLLSGLYKLPHKDSAVLNSPMEIRPNTEEIKQNQQL